MAIESMKEEIKKWLSQKKRDFQQGAELYDKYGSNKILAKLFRNKHSQAMLEKLVYELSKIAGHNEITAIPSISADKQKLIDESLKKITEPKTEPVVLPDPVQDADMERRRAKLFNDRARLSNKLRECNTDSERKNIIEEIKAVEREYYSVIESVKHVQINGSLPEDKPVKNSKYQIPATMELKMQALLNARSRKSKAISKAKKLGDTPAGLKKQKEIQQEENFIKSLEAALK